VSYAKLYSTITESSLWSEPCEVRVLFMSMLARADATGYVEAAVPGLARIANLTVKQTEDALAVLMSPDPYSKSQVEEGRRIVKVERGWMLVNYEDYRNRRDEEARREYMRNLMRERRKSADGSVSNVSTDVSNVSSDVSRICLQLATVSSSKPPLAQAEAEAAPYAEANAVNIKEGEAGKPATPAPKPAKHRRLTPVRDNPPTIREVCDYANERVAAGYGTLNPNEFFNRNEAAGWVHGRNGSKDVVDWRAHYRAWDKPAPVEESTGGYTQDQMDALAEIEAKIAAGEVP